MQLHQSACKAMSRAALTSTLPAAVYGEGSSSIAELAPRWWSGSSGKGGLSLRSSCVRPQHLLDADIGPRTLSGSITIMMVAYLSSGVTGALQDCTRKAPSDSPGQFLTRQNMEAMAREEATVRAASRRHAVGWTPPNVRRVADMMIKRVQAVEDSGRHAVQ
ncbi:hypothetical protein BV20DRAFT_298023 [Pilatotrama ljubarskyi]|nr:hypothetical protein BV20DRAFT_298023 [Pilatotrama ljubarskyi]